MLNIDGIYSIAVDYGNLGSYSVGHGFLPIDARD